MNKIMVMFVFLFFIHHIPAAGEERNITNADNEHLYVFLQISPEEYDLMWKEGKTLAEIAKSQGVSERELVRYLFEKELETMRVSLKNGELSHVQYIQNILRLKETLLHKIHGNPHKEPSSEKVSN
ncbi:hypothetical protein ACFOU2_23140 [Bacillus songklensis]|uniref:Helix-turn-helix domain-containing protein n=1 Tax=Bacillus songklensis TaxID=1069116 RepID=A0ABV8B8H4_9BACI